MLQGEGIARPGDQEEEARGQQDSYSQGWTLPFSAGLHQSPRGSVSQPGSPSRLVRKLCLCTRSCHGMRSSIGSEMFTLMVAGTRGRNDIPSFSW